MDSDDLLHAEKLEIQVPKLLGQKANVVFCNVEAINRETWERVELYRPRETDFFRQVCFDKIQTSGPIHWKKDILAVGGFRECLPCAQEKDLHLRLAAIGQSFCHHDDTLVTVRRRSESLSSDYTRVLEQRPGIYENAFRMLMDGGRQNDDRACALAEAMATTAAQNLSRGREQEARTCFSLAGQMHRSRGLRVFSSSRRLADRLLGVRLVHRLDLLLRKRQAS